MNLYSFQGLIVVVKSLFGNGLLAESEGPQLLLATFKNASVRMGIFYISTYPTVCTCTDYTLRKIQVSK